MEPKRIAWLQDDATTQPSEESEDDGPPTLDISMSDDDEMEEEEKLVPTTPPLAVDDVDVDDVDDIGSTRTAVEDTARFWLDDERKRQFYSDLVRLQIRRNKNPFDNVKHLGLRSENDLAEVGEIIFDAFEKENKDPTRFLVGMMD